MQSKSFHWFSHHAHYAMPYNCENCTRDFLGKFQLYFRLVFYILGAFLMKHYSEVY